MEKQVADISRNRKRNGKPVVIQRGDAMNPLLPVIVVLLLVIVGLMCYVTHLLDDRERLLGNLEAAAHGYPKKHV